MCTVILRVDPGGAVPLALAANRDELLGRPWDAPAAWWPEQPEVVGGRDRLAGGTWLAVNGAGVVAGVLNRVGSLGPAAGKRSRGELPLLALRHGSARAAAAAIAATDAGLWRAYNLVLADRDGAVCVIGLGEGRPEVVALGGGVHMVTAHDPDSAESPRVVRHLPRFRAAPAPTPAEFSAWRAILADRSGPAGTELNIPPAPRPALFGTVCAALLFLPGPFLFAAGPPHEATFRPVPGPGSKG
jgi:hypothetical protein